MKKPKKNKYIKRYLEVVGGGKASIAKKHTRANLSESFKEKSHTPKTKKLKLKERYQLRSLKKRKFI